jgi:hypothetical protein
VYQPQVYDSRRRHQLCPTQYCFDDRPFVFDADQSGGYATALFAKERLHELLCESGAFLYAVLYEQHAASLQAKLDIFAEYVLGDPLGRGHGRFAQSHR